MFRITARFSRRVVVGALTVSLTAAGAVAGTIHTFSVSQTTGSEGAVDFLQTSVPGGALQGEVGSSASTALGTPFGVFGKYGPASAKAAKGIGVLGVSSLGWGVVGESLNGYPALYAFANTKDGIGLNAQSQNQEAIYAEALGDADGLDLNADGFGYGFNTYSNGGPGGYVEGGGGDGLDAFSDDGTDGVYGQSTGYGVEGFSSISDGVHAEISNSNSGVAGINDGSGNGVSGLSANGPGVNAQSLATPGPVPTGALYQYAATYSQSASGPGVYGIDSHNTGAVGIGTAYDRYTGVSGSASDGVGVYGYSSSDIGMLAENDSNTNATLVVNNDNTSSGGDEILAGSGGVTKAGYNFAVETNGNEVVGGTVTSGGGSFAVTRNPRSDAVTYGAESTEPMVEDVGSAQLVNGSAAVPLAPDFRQTIEDATRYLVFITPEGDSKGLYVTQKSPAGFVVREAQGGRSTMEFDYRIVAQRYGVRTGRLPHLAAISPHMAQFRFAALHPNASEASANTPRKYAMVAPPLKTGSKHAALLARARIAAAAAHRRLAKPPAPPPGFLAAVRP